MDKVKILWIGISGRTGVQAEKLSSGSLDTEIVAGIRREKQSGYYTIDELDSLDIDFDMIIDFSHTDIFDRVLDFALRHNKTLISGTSGLSDNQLEKLERASHKIPIFRGGNFRFEIENFIDSVVEYAKTHDEINLIETHYKTKKVPSETAKVIAKRVYEETGKTVSIESRLEYDDYINDWRVEDLHARIEKNGFETLARDVLKIAVLMKNKKPNGLYSLKSLLVDCGKNDNL